MAYRVLIVDDQKEVSRLLRSALETIEKDLIVLEAPSGEEAILEASRNKIDLLVADFRLPGITGVELMKKIRARNPEVKVIMVTGVTEPKLLKQVAESGADAYFSKPVPMADFLDAVERTLGLARTILHKADAETDSASIDTKTLKGLSNMLVSLRKELGAEAVLLLNGLGHVEAEAGQLPDPNMAVSLISSLMGMFIAAQKVATFLDRAETHLHIFDGKKTDAVALPVGGTHALLVVGRGLAAKSLAGKLDVLFAARTEITQTLQGMGFGAETAKPKANGASPEEPFTEPEDVPSEFMDIFTQIGKKTDDAKSFWDSAVENGTTFAEPDKLTYEQASRLGLTPDSAQEK